MNAGDDLHMQIMFAIISVSMADIGDNATTFKFLPECRCALLDLVS